MHDTGSARFSQDGTYTGEIMIDAGISGDIIQQRQLFHAGLQDLLFEKASITAVLSERIVMFELWKFIWSSQYIASSNTTVSAQPMSRLSATQPSMRHQPAYQSLKANPTPKEVDASMCKLGSQCCLGIRDCIIVGPAKQSRHRFMSLVTACGV